jgi:DNA-binding NarL/FixJ family response regulator
MDYIDVWIIEDNNELRETLTEVINNAPDMMCSLNFDYCENAIESLQTESPPQIILMDIGLPGMSGIEGVRHIKAISPTTNIIMLTVFEDNDKIFESLCAGASGYLLKRISGDKILEAIRDAWEGGAPMNAQIARKVLTMFTSLVAPQANYSLTSREKEILDLLVSGLSQKMIADKLFLSPFTIGTHIKNIYSKMQVHSRSEVVAKALKEKLI